MLERLFKLNENGTNVRTEVMGGITTFMTMAYILAVNPAILSDGTGMDPNAIFLSPVFIAIPSFATAPALIFVRFLMVSSVTELELILSAIREKITPLMYVLAVLFVMKYIFL